MAVTDQQAQEALDALQQAQEALTAAAEALGGDLDQGATAEEDLSPEQHLRRMQRERRR